MALLMDLFSNPAHAELLKSKLDELKSDDELKPVLEEIESGGQEAMMKYMTDTEVMSKLGKKFQELLKDPEFKARRVLMGDHCVFCVCVWREALEWTVRVLDRLGRCMPSHSLTHCYCRRN